MYEFGTLRPPTAVDLASRQVVLETIEVSWICGSGHHECREEGYGVTNPYRVFALNELAVFCQDNGIPYGAWIVAAGQDGELALDWSHLTLCECREWFAGSPEEHRASDYHVMIMVAREWRPSPEDAARLRAIIAEQEAQESRTA